jgi:predicted nucleic acid-binding protein
MQSEWDFSAADGLQSIERHLTFPTSREMIRAVMDTNVLVAGLRSPFGASHEFLARLRAGGWSLVLSNTVLGEYHEILHREAAFVGLTHREADSYIDALCFLAEKFTPTTQWQPAANDPDDEAIIQLAREAQVVYLVAHNVRDVSRAGQFGMRVVRPAEFLEILRQTT